MRIKNIVTSIITGVAIFLTSCGSSIESDAKKAAELMCEAYQNPDKSISLTIQMEEISEKYEGDDKVKFEEIAEKEYENCLKETLKSLSNSEIMRLENEDENMDEDEGEYEYEEIADKAVEDVSKEIEKIVGSTKGNNDIDAYLKSYEEYVDQYIKFMKKAKDGDMAAMAEYAEYMEKATELSDKMERSESEMTSAQMSKFMKIQAKLMQAAANMY